MVVPSINRSITPPPLLNPTAQRHAHRHRATGGHTTNNSTNNKSALPLWPRLVSEIETIDRRLLALLPLPTQTSQPTWGQTALCRLCGMVLQRVARSGSLFAPATMRAVVKVRCVCALCLYMCL